MERTERYGRSKLEASRLRKRSLHPAPPQAEDSSAPSCSHQLVDPYIVRGHHLNTLSIADLIGAVQQGAQFDVWGCMTGTGAGRRSRVQLLEPVKAFDDFLFEFTGE